MMSDLARVKPSLVVERPIVYGNVATHLGKAAVEKSHTHRWTVYVRGLHGEDISQYVSKVVFKLHDSFKDPTRVVDKPPFEVTEQGWGEFEIQIKIHFVNMTERPVTLYHMLKLYDSEGVQVVSKKTLGYEQYDELAFYDPSDALYASLVSPAATTKKLVQNVNSWDVEERKALAKIDGVREKLRNELASASAAKLRLENEVAQLKKEVAMGSTS